MIEYYGWCTISESTCEAEDCDETLNAIARTVEEKSQDLAQFNTFAKFRWLNGRPRLVVFGAHNHKGPHWVSVLDLFGWIAQNAVGSYGLLYYLDDEADIAADSDRFQVLVLRRGSLIREPDRFLSPIDPMLEDFSN